MGVEGLELAVVAHRTRHTHCEEEGETEGCSHIGLCSLSCSLSLSLFFDQANRRTTEDVIAQLNEKSVRLLPRGK